MVAVTTKAPHHPRHLWVEAGHGTPAILVVERLLRAASDHEDVLAGEGVSKGQPSGSRWHRKRERAFGMEELPTGFPGANRGWPTASGTDSLGSWLLGAFWTFHASIRKQRSTRLWAGLAFL